MPESTDKKIDLRTMGYYISDKNYWIGAGTKLVDTLISVKVWGLISILTVSTWMLNQGLISGGEWTTVNTTIFGIIYGMREIFKISRVSSYMENLNNSEHKDE